MLRIDNVEDSKYYVVYITRLDSRFGDRVRFVPIRIVGGFSYQKAKKLQTAFDRESPMVRRELPDGAKEMINWRCFSGKTLKKMVNMA